VSHRIDLNVDMGESFGRRRLGDERRRLETAGVEPAPLATLARAA
jgi:lactam utilization protein B